MTRRRRVQKCVGCGRCCGHYLPLSDEDIKRVKSYIEKHDIIPRWTGIDCPFLADNRTCVVYEVRPAICRAYHCDVRKVNVMGMDPDDYHVYNTERLFIYGDDARYDYLKELAGAMRRESFDVLFKKGGER